jgi:ABC-type uncharacterized transport system substrate-binding protein
MRILKNSCLAACAFFVAVTSAAAHPHVWVEVKSQVVFDANGVATGVRHTWQFDDMYSAFALEGLQQKTKGVFTREELKDLAEVNITNLKESDFFTFAKAGGKDLPLGDASDYYLEYNKDVLTLHFTVAFKTPQQAKQLSVEVYDPAYFVAFGFAEKDAASLAGAPAQCKAAVEKPQELSMAEQQKKMTDPNFNPDNWGSTFASKVVVNCP